MATVCYICNKERQAGSKVSHSNRHSNRRWNPNIKRVKALVDGSPKRIYVCTRCLRSGKVVRSV
ncbi:MAG TPA: 50S ribosomal protein L28 [Bacillota bacterium]|nr:50S ribosomal protein L28 [Bacillota bacterium]